MLRSCSGQVKFTIGVAELSESSSSLGMRAVNNAEFQRRGIRTMYRGMLVLCPKIVVDQSTLVTSRRMRGRNHKLCGELEKTRVDRTCWLTDEKRSGFRGW